MLEIIMFNIFLIILGLSIGKLLTPSVSAGFFMIVGVFLIWISRHHPSS